MLKRGAADALVALSALKQGISQYPPRKSAASGSGAEAEESGPQPKLQRDVVSFENIGHASPRLPLSQNGFLLTYNTFPIIILKF